MVDLSGVRWRQLGLVCLLLACMGWLLLGSDLADAAPPVQEQPESPVDQQQQQQPEQQQPEQQQPEQQPASPLQQPVTDSTTVTEPVTPQLTTAAPIPGAELPGLSGTVVDTSGAPLPGTKLALYRRQGNEWAVTRRTTANAAGFFRIPLVAGGAYRLYADDPAEVYAGAYLPSALEIEQGEDVVVNATPLSGLAITLTPAAQISGTVSWQNGPRPYNAQVQLFRRQETLGRSPQPDAPAMDPELRRWQTWEETTLEYAWPPTTTVAVTGTATPAVAPEQELPFHFDGLPPGAYRLCVYAFSLRDDRRECFDDALFGSTATDLTLAAGETRADLAVALGASEDYAQITGRLTSTVAGADGPAVSPAAGLQVQAAPEGSVDFFGQTLNRSAETDANGIYTLTEIVPGDYTLTFSDPSDDFLPGRYGESAESEPAVLQLAPGETRTVNVAVTPAAQLTGTVRIGGDIAGFAGQVSAYRLAGESYSLEYTTDIDASTGVYALKGLQPGQYRLRFVLHTTALASEIFLGGQSLETATDFRLTQGETAANVDLDLASLLGAASFGVISGTVQADDAPRAGMRVEVYGAAANVAPAPMTYARTDEQGQYRIAGLPSGAYKIGFVDSNGVFATTYYNGRASFARAQQLVIGGSGAGEEAAYGYANVNGQMVQAGTIDRTVALTDGRLLSSTAVLLYWRGGDVEPPLPLVATRMTDAAGSYTFTGLQPGPYQICVAVDGLAESDCAGQGGRGRALNVTVLAGVVSGGEDVIRLQAPANESAGGAAGGDAQDQPPAEETAPEGQ